MRRCRRASPRRIWTRPSTSTASSGTSALSLRACWARRRPDDVRDEQRPPASLRPAAAAILVAEPRRLPLAPEDLGPLSVLEDRHVAAGTDLERLLAAPQVVEPVAFRFPEPFEPARIGEVAH